MDGRIFLAAVAVSLVVATLGLVKFPRHVLQSSMVGRMWKLLDEIDDSIRRGDLPRNSSEVQRLRTLVYQFAKSSDRIRLLDVLVVLSARRRFPNGHAGAVPEAPVGLRPEQRELFNRFSQRTRLYSPFIVLSGTWTGVLLVVVLTFRVLVAWVIERVRGGNGNRQPQPAESVVKWSVLTIQAEAADESYERRHRRDLVGAA